MRNLDIKKQLFFYYILNTQKISNLTLNSIKLDLFSTINDLSIEEILDLLVLNIKYKYNSNQISDYDIKIDSNISEKINHNLNNTRLIAKLSSENNEFKIEIHLL